MSEKTLGTMEWKTNYPILECLHLVTVRCADARDIGRLENEVTRRLLIEYAARGTMVTINRIVRAGGIVNSYSSPEVKNAILDGLKRAMWVIGPSILDPFGHQPALPNSVPFMPVVQISGHAEVHCDEHSLVHSSSQLHLNEHSIVNCGMSHASEVWASAIELLLKEKPEVEFYDKKERKRVKIKIDSEARLSSMLQSLYTFEGENPHEFITSIDLIQEPLKSKAYLRSELNLDNELSSLAININAGIRNFVTGAEYRIDDNTHVHTLLDDKAAIVEYVMEKLPKDHPEVLRRGSKQKPVLGLISSPGIEYPRETIIDYLSVVEKKNLDVAGNVFLALGPNLLNPFSTFSPYKLGGILYSVVVLGIKDYYVLARTASEAALICQKIENDPILSTFMKKFAVKLTVVTMDQVVARGVITSNFGSDSLLSSLIDEGVKMVLSSTAHKNSVLHRQVIAPEVLNLIRMEKNSSP